MIEVIRPSVSSRPHEEAVRFVTGRGFARPMRRADFFTIGGDNGDRQHIVLHGPVRSTAFRARGAGRGHPAERGIGAWVDGEEEARVRR